MFILDIILDIILVYGRTPEAEAAIKEEHGLRFFDQTTRANKEAKRIKAVIASIKKAELEKATIHSRPYLQQMSIIEGQIATEQRKGKSANQETINKLEESLKKKREDVENIRKNAEAIAAARSVKDLKTVRALELERDRSLLAGSLYNKEIASGEQATIQSERLFDEKEEQLGSRSEGSSVSLSNLSERAKAALNPLEFTF